MDLDAIKAGGECISRRATVLLDDLGDFGNCQRTPSRRR
jgi:hypothetical protein